MLLFRKNQSLASRYHAKAGSLRRRQTPTIIAPIKSSKESHCDTRKAPSIKLSVRIPSMKKRPSAYQIR